MGGIYPRNGISKSKSTNAHLEFAEFGADFPVGRMDAEIAQVRVDGDPFEVAITEVEGLLEGAGGKLAVVGKGVTAGKVVVDEGVLGAEADEVFIDAEAVGEFAAAGVIIAEDLQGFDEPRVALDNALHETDFQIQVALFASS